MLCLYPAARLGYSGTALFSRNKPIDTWSDPFISSSSSSSASSSSSEKEGEAEDDDDDDDDDDGSREFAGEGRVVVAELPGCFVVGAYVPNSGDGLKRLGGRTGGWDPALARYLAELERRGKPVVYCG